MPAPSIGKIYLVRRGRDIIFDEGEGLYGLYSITYVGPEREDTVRAEKDSLIIEFKK